MTHLCTMRLGHALPLAFGLAFAWPEPVELENVGATALLSIAAEPTPTPAISLASAPPAKRRAEA